MDPEKHEINKGLKNVSNFREFHKDHAQCDLLFKSSQKSKTKNQAKNFPDIIKSGLYFSSLMGHKKQNQSIKYTVSAILMERTNLFRIESQVL